MLYFNHPESLGGFVLAIVGRGAGGRNGVGEDVADDGVDAVEVICGEIWVAVKHGVGDDDAVADDEDVRDGDSLHLWVEAGLAWGLVAVVDREVAAESVEEGDVALVVGFAVFTHVVVIVERNAHVDGDLEEARENRSAGWATRDAEEEDARAVIHEFHKFVECDVDDGIVGRDGDI